MPKKPLSVWVNSHMDEMEYALMSSAGIVKAQSAEDADIIFFVGGADVNPALYGEEPLKGITNYSDITDRRDIEMWRKSVDKFKVGICRGGQFLNVMNGGSLWQDVDNHTRSHMVRDQFTNRQYLCTSTHHQQFKPAASAVVIGVARETTYKQGQDRTWKIKNNNTPMDNYFQIDHEVLWYPATRTLCFQPHPEYVIRSACGDFFREVLDRCLHNGYDKSQLSGKTVLS